MIQEKTISNTREITVDTYDGNKVTHSITKEAGNSFHTGGTASHRTIVIPVLIVAVYTDEQDGLSYCDFYLYKNTTKIYSKKRTCGNVKQNTTGYLMETLDLNCNVRWLVIDKVPQQPNKHFVSVFEKDATMKTIRCLRIDPFFGEGVIIDG